MKLAWIPWWAALAVSMAAPAANADSSLPRGMAGSLIRHYHMQRVAQEGPWFSVTYASEDELQPGELPARYAGKRSAGSAIVVLETPADFSAMHRLQTDEVWHFYDGAPLDMLLLYPDGTGRRITLGPHVLAGELRQFTVPHGVWQGSAPRGAAPTRYSFAADQLSPGFDYADLEMGYRDALARQYPAYARDIERLTRPQFIARPAGAPARSAPQPPAAAVFAAADVPVLTPSPGMSLLELVGLQAPLAPTSRLSVAQFSLAPGHATGASYNHHSEEVFVVTGGSGQVTLDGHTVAVAAGSTVYLPALQVHSIEAGADSTLTFLAISAPAFTPDDYVRASD